jgi:NADPH:quinone reductase-like Zn-dependent oxidoreductase
MSESNEKMRAMAWPHAGSPEAPKVVDVDAPSPQRGEVLVRVVASAVNPADEKVSSGSFVGRLLHARVSPLVLGYDFSGVVEACGADVTDLPVGAEVAGHLAYAGATRQGAFAERVAVDRTTIAVKPASVSHEVAAAAATPALTALQSLRDLGRLPDGGRALIVGAAGGVGSLAIGVGKRLGGKVTAVCSTYAMDFVKGLGADEVVDRKAQDPLTLPGPFDVVFDAAAAYSYLACKHQLTPKGAYVRTLPDLGIGLGKAAALFSGRRCEFIIVESVRKDLELVFSWIADGMKVPIDARFPVRDLAKGLDKLRRGEVRGRLAIQVEGGF